MTWDPFSEQEILDLISKSFQLMTLEQQRLWQTISITPEKWVESTYGDKGGGFWVVALYGNNVVWFNDIEEGFNRSKFSTYGDIAEYWCNQDELQWTINHILIEIKTGKYSGTKHLPPEPLSD